MRGGDQCLTWEYVRRDGADVDAARVALLSCFRYDYCMSATSTPSSLLHGPSAVIGRTPAGSFIKVADLPGSPAAAAAAASRAAAAGTLRHIRHGLYFKGKPTRYGPTQPTAEAVAREVLGTKGVGPAGFSAAHALGVTTQIPALPEFAVAGPKPTGLKGVRVTQRSNMSRRDLTYTEIALLEVLRDPKTLVEGPWSRLVEAARSADFRGQG